jgi:hypothetical protein
MDIMLLRPSPDSSPANVAGQFLIREPQEWVVRPRTSAYLEAATPVPKNVSGQLLTRQPSETTALSRGVRRRSASQDFATIINV